MRKIFVPLITLSFIAAAFVGTTANAATTLSCSNPQTLTTKQGTIHFPGNLTVQQDEWSPRAGETQTMKVCSPASWAATVSVGGQPSDGVTTYPDSGTTYPDSCATTHKLSTIASLTSTYAMQPPTVNASYDEAYDLFLGGGLCNEPFTEVMVWNHFNDISVPNAQIHKTIDNVAYDIFHTKGYIQVRMHNPNDSGSINLGHILAVLVRKGLLTDTHLIFTQYGVEVLTTFGQPVTWTLTDFSVTTTLR